MINWQGCVHMHRSSNICPFLRSHSRPGKDWMKVRLPSPNCPPWYSECRRPSEWSQNCRRTGKMNIKPVDDLSTVPPYRSVRSFLLHCTACTARMCSNYTATPTGSSTDPWTLHICICCPNSIIELDLQNSNMALNFPGNNAILIKTHAWQVLLERQGQPCMIVYSGLSKNCG